MKNKRWVPKVGEVVGVRKEKGEYYRIVKASFDEVFGYFYYGGTGPGYHLRELRPLTKRERGSR